MVILALLVGCSNGNSDETAQGSQGGESVKTDRSLLEKIQSAEGIGFEIVIFEKRGDMNAVMEQQIYNSKNLTWDGLNFDAHATYKKEVPLGAIRADVQENINIKGKITQDGKFIESLIFSNERDIIDHGKTIKYNVQIVDIPWVDDNDDFQQDFKRSESAENVSQMIKVYDEQETGQQVRDLEAHKEYWEKLDRFIEIRVDFR